MTDTYTIPETPLAAGGRLGRHVNHDDRSRAYRVATAEPKTVMWQRRTPVLDQGDLGSCTGNAAVGALGTDPFTGTAGGGFTGTESDAVQVYEKATQLDPFPGAYPPEDTGSDGLSVAKACKGFGWIAGYEHALAFGDVLGGLQTRPGILGVNWYDSFDAPFSTGVVTLPDTAQVRGGHEIEAVGCDMVEELVWCVNSWGDEWGVDGHFAFPFDVLERLLSEDGDATFFTRNGQPAPGPTFVTRQFTAADAALLTDWANAPHWWRKSTKAAQAWKRSLAL